MSEYHTCYACCEPLPNHRDNCPIALRDADIEAHLSGTGHADLASMRREFDAMRAEVNTSRRYVDRLWKDLDNVAVPRPPYYPGLTREYTEAKEATDSTRPKEPAKEKDNA